MPSASIVPLMVSVSAMIVAVPRVRELPSVGRLERERLARERVGDAEWCRRPARPPGSLRSPRRPRWPETRREVEPCRNRSVRRAWAATSAARRCAHRGRFRAGGPWDAPMRWRARRAPRARRLPAPPRPSRARREPTPTRPRLREDGRDAAAAPPWSGRQRLVRAAAVAAVAVGAITNVVVGPIHRVDRRADEEHRRHDDDHAADHDLAQPALARELLAMRRDRRGRPGRRLAVEGTRERLAERLARREAILGRRRHRPKQRAIDVGRQPELLRDRRRRWVSIFVATLTASSPGKARLPETAS